MLTQRTRHAVKLVLWKQNLADDDSTVILQYACNVSIKDQSPLFRDRMADVKKLNKLLQKCRQFSFGSSDLHTLVQNQACVKFQPCATGLEIHVCAGSTIS